MSSSRQTKRLSAIQIPAFTAEASLYQTSGQCNAARSRPASTDARVQSQFTLARYPIIWCGGLYCCDEHGNCFHRINVGGGAGVTTIM